MRVIKPFRKLLKKWDKGAIKGQAFIDAYQADTRELLDVVSHYNKLENEMYNLGFPS